MLQPLGDKTHEMFWQQLLRWLVSESPGQVMASTPDLLSDDTKVVRRARDSSRPLRMRVRRTFQGRMKPRTPLS
jgi:hypothetical protein